MLKNAWSVFKSSVSRFRDKDCATRAASVAFFAFFSLIPVLFFLVATVGFLLGSDAALLGRVVAVVKNTVPYLSEAIIKNVSGLAEKSEHLGGVGLFMLAWCAFFVFRSLENSLDAVFEAGEKRSFLKRNLASAAIFILLFLSVFFFMLLGALRQIVVSIDLAFFQYALVKKILGSVLLNVFIMLLTVYAVALVYKTTAGRRLSMNDSFAGAAVFFVLWEAAKYLFSVYISKFPAYNTFYGSLGALMILLIWIYYSMVILLFGACVAVSCRNNR